MFGVAFIVQKVRCLSDKNLVYPDRCHFNSRTFTVSWEMPEQCEPRGTKMTARQLVLLGLSDGVTYNR